MNSHQHRYVKQLLQHRLMWSFTLVIWLFFLTLSIVHAQEHEFEEGNGSDYQCHLCTNNFSDTPFILTTHFGFDPILQQSDVENEPTCGLIRVHQLIICNRGPPSAQ